MKKPVFTTFTIAIAAIVLFVVITIIFRLVQSTLNKNHNNMPVGIVTTKVILKSSPFSTKTQGIIEASKSVVVKPQASGLIKNINFTPGQYVKAGQSLFVIDPAIYQTNLAKAQANLAQDQAQLISIEKDKERYQSLIKEGFVSKQQFEQLQAKLDTQLSIIKADKALVNQAQIELGYTNIAAPIGGKTGNVIVKEGTLISSTAAQDLVTINQLNPVLVDFYLPQKYISLLAQYQKESQLTVNVYLENDNKLLDTGKLSFVDNTLNSNTGTLLLKASMPNNNLLLLPGETVVSELIFTIEKNVLSVPTKAVQTGQQGQFVYLIKNNQAFITPIKILRQTEEWTFIKQGINQGDIIATIFPPDLQDKSFVTVISHASEHKSSMHKEKE